jgi:hypothetical protein
LEKYQSDALLECSSSWVCLINFSWLDWAYGFWTEYHTAEAPTLLITYHSRGTYLHTIAELRYVSASQY